ncbi:MAG TPA: hypothetical protein VGD68_02330, partial [Streptosporangiaceae bacterium]
MSTWPTTRKRPLGRHTSLIDGGDDPGRDDPAGAGATFGGWLPPDPAGRRDGAGPPGWPGDRGSGPMAEPSSPGSTGTRVWIRGEDPGRDPGPDTVILGDTGPFHQPRPGAGLSHPGPPAPWHRAPWSRAPWYRARWWLLAMTAGLIALIWVGIAEMPPLLAAVGIDAPPACQLCQFPLPSSPPVGPGTGSAPAVSSLAPP